MGAREAMEEEIEPYSIKQAFWTPSQLGVLTIDQLQFVANALMGSQYPLLITGYTGREHEGVQALVRLADIVKGLRILDTAGADMCFPADHPAWLGLRYGEHDAITKADVIIVVECDVNKASPARAQSSSANMRQQVPWITARCRPRKDATVIQIDSEPLKHTMQVFYLDAVARIQAHPTKCLEALAAYIEHNFGSIITSDAFVTRWDWLVEAHQARLSQIVQEARPTVDGSLSPAFLMSQLRTRCPVDTVWVVEAVTSAFIAADQIQATIPGSWVNCGGGGLGWSGGGALGVKLATDL